MKSLSSSIPSIMYCTCCIDISHCCYSTRPDVLFLVRFNDFAQTVGITWSYSSRLFFCTLVVLIHGGTDLDSCTTYSTDMDSHMLVFAHTYTSFHYTLVMMYGNNTITKDL